MDAAAFVSSFASLCFAVVTQAGVDARTADA